MTQLYHDITYIQTVVSATHFWQIYMYDDPVTNTRTTTSVVASWDHSYGMRQFRETWYHLAKASITAPNAKHLHWRQWTTRQVTPNNIDIKLLSIDDKRYYDLKLVFSPLSQAKTGGRIPVSKDISDWTASASNQWSQRWKA